MPPGHPPKPPKIDPRRSQETTFSLLNFDLVLGSILAPFWLPKCLPLGTLLATKIDQKINQKLDCSKCRPKIATRPPKTSPGPPKTLPRGPRAPILNDFGFQLGGFWIDFGTQVGVFLVSQLGNDAYILECSWPLCNHPSLQLCVVISHCQDRQMLLEC